MAETTHNLGIKATLDAEQVKNLILQLKEACSPKALTEDGSATFKVDAKDLTAALGQFKSSIADFKTVVTGFKSAIEQNAKNMTSQSAAHSSSIGIDNLNIGRLAKFAVGSYGLGLIGNSLADLNDAYAAYLSSGTQQTGELEQAASTKSKVNDVKSIVGSAVAGGAVGGPVGAIAGTALATANIMLLRWTDALSKSKEVIESWLAKFKDAKSTAASIAEYHDKKTTQQFISQAVERGDLKSLQEVRDKAYHDSVTAASSYTAKYTPDELSKLEEEAISRQKRHEELYKKGEGKNLPGKIYYLNTSAGLIATLTGGSRVGRSEEEEKEYKENAKRLKELNEILNDLKQNFEKEKKADIEIAQYDAAIAQVKAKQKAEEEKALAEKKKREAEAKAEAKKQSLAQSQVTDNLEKINEEQYDLKFGDIWSGKMKSLEKNGSLEDIDKAKKLFEHNYEKYRKQFEQQMKTAQEASGKTPTETLSLMQEALKNAQKAKKRMNQWKSASDSLASMYDSKKEEKQLKSKTFDDVFSSLLSLPDMKLNLLDSLTKEGGSLGANVDVQGALNQAAMAADNSPVAAQKETNSLLTIIKDRITAIETGLTTLTEVIRNKSQTATIG